MSYSFNLQDKVAVITGAAGVLCSGFAKVIVESGAKVALLDINKESVEKTADELNKDYPNCAKAYAVNVLEKIQLEKCKDQILSDFGKIDILINGAGGNSPKATTSQETYEKCENKQVKTFFDLEESGVKFVFDLNFLGTFLTTQVFAQSMLENGGCILNVSSMNAFSPLTKIPAYSAAKSSISNFTQWLAVHFADTNIRVNAIAPGFFATNQNRQLLFNEKGELTPRSEKILAHTPMKRFGKVEDLFASLLFLIDEDAARFITGIVMPVDGGFSAYSGV